MILAVLVCFFAPTLAGVFIKYEEGIDKRIINGDDTTIETHQWQVSLQRGSGSSWSHSCGGSIISKEWVLTAAHCVDGSSASSLRIAAGSNNWKEGKVTRKIAEIKQHPDYDGISSGFPNDIAVLKLESPLDFDDTVSAIELASDNDFTNVKCEISGWGQTDNGIPDILQRVYMTVISNIDCSNKWSVVSGGINDGHICIGNDEDVAADKSACFGDSGGPMICNSQLAGATSWGSGSCSSFPNVYTRVSHFRKWVRDTTGV